MTEQTIPQEAIELLKEYRPLFYDYKSLMYRIGTNGEKGLHPQRKSLMSKMGKIEKKLKVHDYRFADNGFDVFLRKSIAKK
jgi:hypothetical protein